MINGSNSIDHFKNAIALMFHDNNDEALREFLYAFKLGLPDKERAETYALIGKIYIEQDKLLEGINEIEKSIILDSEGSFDTFKDDTFRRSIFRRFDAACNKRAREIEDESGIEKSISYLQQKINLVNYLHGKYFPLIRYRLSKMYAVKADIKAKAGEDENNEVELAIQSLRDCLESEYYGIKDLDSEMKKMAQDGLRNIENIRSRKISEQEEKSGCLIASASMGTPLAKEIFILYRFRDEILRQTKLGNLMIYFYYKISPIIAIYISRLKILRCLVRIVIIQPLSRLCNISLKKIGFK